MAVNDLFQFRQDLRKQLLIPAGRDVSCNSMKKPQRCISGMIEALGVAFWKHVGNQPFTDVMRKSSQNVTGLYITARGQRQAFEADHRVSARIVSQDSEEATRVTGWVSLRSTEKYPGLQRSP